MRDQVAAPGARREASAEFQAHGLRLLGASIGMGCGNSVYPTVASIFFVALEGSFHWSKSASATSLVTLPLTALSLPLIGRLLDRFGVARVAFCSTLCFAACLFLLSFMSGAIVQFYALTLAMTVLGAGTGPISYTRVIAAYFFKARGLALSLALVGSPAVSAIMPLIVTGDMAANGWRHAYRMVALITLVGGALAAALVGRPPSAKDHADPRTLTGVSLRRALQMPAFWLLCASLLSFSIAGFGFDSQLQSIGLEKGLSPARASLMISLLSLSVIPSRLVVGWALDVVDPRLAGGAAFLLAAVGALVVSFSPHGSLGALSVGVLLMGASFGAEFDLMSYFCAHCFGLKNYASIYGVIMSFFYIGFAAGGIAYGQVHDRTGSYLIALLSSAVLMLLASVLLLPLPREPLGPAKGAAAVL
jgi:MFS family permease